MSRSRRKEPLFSYCGSRRRGEGPAKRMGNRKMRRVTKQAVDAGREVLPHRRVLDNLYDYPSDGGKAWMGHRMDQWWMTRQMRK